mgnify:FL=1
MSQVDDDDERFLKVVDERSKLRFEDVQQQSETTFVLSTTRVYWNP